MLLVNCLKNFNNGLTVEEYISFSSSRKRSAMYLNLSYNKVCTDKSRNLFFNRIHRLCNALDLCIAYPLFLYMKGNITFCGHSSYPSSIPRTLARFILFVLVVAYRSVITNSI